MIVVGESCLYMYTCSDLELRLQLLLFDKDNCVCYVRGTISRINS